MRNKNSLTRYNSQVLNCIDRYPMAGQYLMFIHCLKNVVIFPAVCQRQCQNGGRCFKKDQCSCPYGYWGDVCQYGEKHWVLFLFYYPWIIVCKQLFMNNLFEEGIDLNPVCSLDLFLSIYIFYENLSVIFCENKVNAKRHSLSHTK